VVTRDVPDYALMKGNPARQTGWMSRHGHVLKGKKGAVLRCPEAGLKYQLDAKGWLRCLDLDENASIPAELARGKKSYREFER
jgi:UDP-2-acetamido-3-amino-2,3-dideoxy-glucuronate N-acetyltransferase